MFHHCVCSCSSAIQDASNLMFEHKHKQMSQIINVSLLSILLKYKSKCLQDFFDAEFVDDTHAWEWSFIIEDIKKIIIQKYATTEPRKKITKLPG
jgi:hypothetical protein